MFPRLATLASMVALFAGAVTSAEAGRIAMVVKGESSPPIGHVQFCRDNPKDCASYARPNRIVRLSEASLARLRSVNVGVNEAVVPGTDKQIYGVLEYWTYPGLMGDCEDYVLEKRRMLASYGWPESALLVTVVRDEAGEGHAVLTVRTDRGDLILDNKTDRILLWDETPYRFVKRQSASLPSAWDEIEDSRTMLVGSVK